MHNYLVHEDAFARRRSRKVWAQLVPGLAAGLGLTWAIDRAGEDFLPLLPGLWSMVFGLAIFSARPYLPALAVGLLCGTWGLVFFGWLLRRPIRCDSIGSSPVHFVPGSWRQHWCCFGTWSASNMAKRTTENLSQGRFAYQGLERVLHEKARLGIMTSLVTRPEGLLFGELKRLCDLTDGNLSRHLDVLHEGGLVEAVERLRKQTPTDPVPLSRVGRERFLKYLAELERVVRVAKLLLSVGRPRGRSLPAGSPCDRRHGSSLFFSAESLQCKVIVDANHLATSVSSWTATDAGPRDAASPARTVTRSAARPCDASSRRRRTWGSACSRSLLFPPPTGGARPPRSRPYGLFSRILVNETELCCRKGVRLSLVGRRDRLPPSSPPRSKPRSISPAMAMCCTCGWRSTTPREAICLAARRLAVKAGGHDPGEVPLDDFSRLIAAAAEKTSAAPDVDLLIRTGGERRLSDFLLWETRSPNLYFTERMWPEFTAEDLAAAIEDLSRRARFGRIVALADSDVAVAPVAN